MRLKYYVTGLLLIFHSVFLFAANTDVIPPTPDKQMELQLRTQELQLEQELLQIKQRILQLQQTKAQKPNEAQVDLHWVDAANGKNPANSVANVCQADFQGGTHPGQLTTEGCLITYGGRALLQKNYRVLVGKQRTFWKPAEALNGYLNPPLPVALSDRMMRRNWIMISTPVMFIEFPVQGGFEQDHPLYICRAMYDNAIHLGKVVANQCNIAVKDKEIAVGTYEVLFSSLQ